MRRIPSFQRRVFLVLLAVAVVPAAALLVLGALTLREAGSTTGTLGAWDEVARTGQSLLEALGEPRDSAVAAAARAHEEALSESVRWSRLYAFVTGRLVRLLPLAAVAVGGVVLVFSSLAARRLARGLARPIRELVEWTGLVAEGRPLPPADADRGRRILEFEVLRGSLRSMADELEEGRRREVEGARLRAWTEMARRVAHELKNPLTPMRMAAAALARDAEGPSAEAVAVLGEEIDRLDEMARTFAQFGRMPEGPTAPVDLGELAREVAGLHSGGDRTVVVRAAGGPARVQGYYELLRRALTNLVVNAAEAAGAGDGEIEIVVRPPALPGGEAVLAVRDRGPGIDEDLLPRIFMPEVTTKTRGTGLGLALVRQAAEAHGGRAEAENREGGGAEVRMLLPVRAADGKPPPGAGRTAG